MSVLLEGLKRYFTDASLERLGRARVGIAGAGGLGSNLAMLLARSGIRRFLVADHDRVEASNLNRQYFLPGDVGKLKTLALRERIHELDPGIDFDSRALLLVPDMVCGLFQGCDIVVEALDDAAAKAGLCNALLAGGFYVVAASGLAGFGGPPMQSRRMGENFVCVGDFTTGTDNGTPPLAPRVMQAAALQADAVLTKLLQ